MGLNNSQIVHYANRNYKFSRFLSNYICLFIKNLSNLWIICIDGYHLLINMVTFDISQLSEQNLWWVDGKNILKDHKFDSFNKSTYKWDPNIRHYIQLDYDALYTLRGPRQVGKTTLIKIIIEDLLLNKKIRPENVLFWSCERNSAEELHEIVQ